MKYIILLSIVLLVSCNPCKRIAKHPECFPADTVIINNEVIHHETEIVVNDSIVFEQIPCDPVTNTIFDVKTVYKTNTKTIVDTIYQSKETSKINPVNAVLKRDNEKLNSKNEKLNSKLRRMYKVGIIMLIVIIGLLLLVKFK